KAACVAGEAGADLGSRNMAPKGLRERRRLDAGVVRGFVEEIVAGKIADESFVECAVFLDDPGLRTLAQGPVDGLLDGVGAVADGIGAVAAFRLDAIGIWANGGAEIGMRDEF